MSYFINNQQKVNDIIFAQRNKNYGAYAIRSSYGNTLLKSLMIMMSGIGTFIGIAYYLTNKHDADDLGGQILPSTVISVTPFDITPKDNKLIKKPVTHPPVTPNNNKQPNTHGLLTIVDSTNIAEPSRTITVATTAVAQGTAASGITVPGEGDGGPGHDFPPAGTGSNSIAESFGVDSQPEFEGGLAALYRFVGRNVKYPTTAADIGQEGTVYVKFVVDEKGKVGSLRLLNNAGYGFDDEALRVVGMIPNFKTPAKVNGHPVKVYYQIPIKFRLR